MKSPETTNSNDYIVNELSPVQYSTIEEAVEIFRKQLDLFERELPRSESIKYVIPYFQATIL